MNEGAQRYEIEQSRSADLRVILLFLSAEFSSMWNQIPRVICVYRACKEGRERRNFSRWSLRGGGTARDRGRNASPLRAYTSSKKDPRFFPGTKSSNWQ